MDTKRLVLAVALSVLIFLGWNQLSLHMGWVKPTPEPNTQSTAPSSPPAATQAVPAVSHAPGTDSVASATSFTPKDGRYLTVETPLYKAVFHSQGGVLNEFSLKKYRQSLGASAPLMNLVSEVAAAHAPLGMIIDTAPSWNMGTWTVSGDNLNLGAGDSGSLRFTGEINGLKITRVLTFSGSSYIVDEKTDLLSTEPRNVRVALSFDASHLAMDDNPSFIQSARYFIFGGTPPGPGEIQHNVTRVAWLHDNKFGEDSSTSDLAPGKLIGEKATWIGIMSNYFLGAVSMSGADAKASAQYGDSVFQVFLGKTLSLGQDTPAALEAAYYFGPKEAASLNAAPNSIGRALDYGLFSIIAKPLVMLLDFLNRYVHNYGLAIILMTVMIKMAFWPLSQKSYKSMDQMKKLQPLMVKIREKYADDKETMNREIMQLYKTYKVNPAGGCLPILVQIPVFFGLYQALLNAIELRQAPFITYLPFTDHLWLADLSSRDPYLITPLVMGATMFLQQRLTPAPGDPTQAKVMMFMPLIFTVMFLTFPAGLVVYWLVNNVISIGQQWWMLRRS